MKILITGATGFIGRKLISALLAQNIEVNYLTKARDKQIEGCKRFFWDTEIGEIDSTCFEDVEVIIHLAGASISGSWSKKGKEDILNSRVNSIKIIQDYLLNNPHTIKQVISASAIGVYANESQLQTEDNYVIGANFLSDVVQQWECAVDVFSNSNIAVCKLRIGLVLDKNQGALPPMTKIVRMNIGSAIGTGKQYYSWIHIDDLIGCFVFATTDKLEGTYNAVASNPVTNKEFMKELCTVLGKKMWLPPTPSFIMKLILGEKSMLVLEGQNVSNEKIQKAGYKFRYSTLNDALKAVFSVK